MKYSIEEAILILNKTPLALVQMLEGLPSAWLRANEGEQTFSPFDVVGHLVHAEEEDWIPRARWILTEGENKEFPPFDRFAMYERFKDYSLTDLLALFAKKREESLAVLRSWNLTEEQLQVKGKHPALGSVTLKELLATWVVHDMTHLSQIVRVIAKQYSDEVGPWKEYLSVLKK